MALLVLVASSSCSRGLGAMGDYEAPARIGQVRYEALREISGMAASGQSDDLLWVHNDSGDEARMYGIRRDGSAALVVELVGAKNEDWEDIALGPPPRSSARDEPRSGDGETEGADGVSAATPKPESSPDADGDSPPAGGKPDRSRRASDATSGAKEKGSAVASSDGDARSPSEAVPPTDEAPDGVGESVAATSDPPPRWIWISDTGDNARRRASLALYGFPEPPFKEGDPLRVVRVRSYVTVRFRLEGGGRDVEALVISPDGREAIVFTKEPIGSQVFRLPLDRDRKEIVDARSIARLGFVGRITGAALSPDGHRLALRNELSITELVLPEARSLGEAFTKELSPRPVRPPVELQGEAITYSRRGDAILTVSEGVAPWIHEIRRRKEEVPSPREDTPAADRAPAR